MELFHYLEPTEKSWIHYPGIPAEETLGHNVSFFNGDKDWFRTAKFDLAILGVPEARNSSDPGYELGPRVVRKWLYGLRTLSSGLRVSDLGDVKGNSLDDRYRALMEVVDNLSGSGTRVVLIGGSQDLTLPALKFLRKSNCLANIAIVDAFLDIDPSGNDFSANAFIQKLVSDNEGCIDDVTVMGNQIYYSSPQQEQYMADHHFQTFRLKDIRGENIDRTEVVLRGSEVLSFDFSALEQAKGLPHQGVMPNGLSNSEACRIFWYAGASDVLKLAGLFNIPVNDKSDNKSGPVASQLVWHFLEGCGTRVGDYPVRSLDTYTYKVVYLDDFDETLHFYHNPENNRWWIEVPGKAERKIVPCHASEYERAMNKDLPEIWWRNFLKTKENVEINKK